MTLSLDPGVRGGRQNLDLVFDLARFGPLLRQLGSAARALRPGGDIFRLRPPAFGTPATTSMGRPRSRALTLRLAADFFRPRRPMKRACSAR